MNIDPDELFKWIDEHVISRQKRNLHRDFSDAVPLAEILKKHFPKLVELHSYTPRNALNQKLNNWDLLNKKVLQKIKINVPPSEQQDLAKAVPGAIEKLLYKVKAKVEKLAKQTGDSSERVYYLDGISNDGTSKEGVVPIKLKNGTKISNQKMVAAELFDKMETDLQAKAEEIAILKEKLEHLDKMLNIKDERINDLTKQLQARDGQGDTPKSRFFKVF